MERNPCSPVCGKMSEVSVYRGVCFFGSGLEGFTFRVSSPFSPSSESLLYPVGSRNFSLAFVIGIADLLFSSPISIGNTRLETRLRSIFTFLKNSTSETRIYVFIREITLDRFDTMLQKNFWNILQPSIPIEILLSRIRGREL